MRKEISPAVAGVVLLLVVVAIGAVMYFRSMGGGHATKPQDLLKDERVRQAIGQRFREQQSQGSGQ